MAVKEKDIISGLQIIALVKDDDTMFRDGDFADFSSFADFFG